MLRILHRWPGLIGALLAMILALSGAALSVFPVLDRVSAPQAEAGLTVAELTERVLQTHPGLEEIRRAPSGRITAYWFEGDTPGAAVIDLQTGADAAPADTSAVEIWLTNLHRELFLGDFGRIVMALAALAMLVLTISGAALVARRMGGWRRWFGRTRGPWAGRLHVELARLAVSGLFLSALTALWMTASTFSLLPDSPVDPTPVESIGTSARLMPSQIDLLAQTPVSALQELSFPYPDDPTDSFTLITNGGTALLDPASGAVLSTAEPSTWQQLSALMVTLHTGQGAAVLGIILGLMALSVPALGLTGVLQWLAASRSGARIKGNAAAGTAETILLVASEGGTTWGFGRSLYHALTAAGQSVHLGDLAQFDPARYRAARRIIFLAATYGEGEAPTSAKAVTSLITGLKRAPSAPLAILGFGDRSFPIFCGFADELATAARAIGWSELLPIDSVDRQSPQDFSRWCRNLGATMAMPLEVSHLPSTPAVQPLTLLSRQDYGAEVQAPTAILRFALPARSLWQRLTRQGLTGFAAGDLLGIVPAGSDMPRFYSLASAQRDGFVEICVRKHAGGLCSTQLMSLEPGDSVAAFLRPNPAFRPAPNNKPVILIGAGTGIGPLAGFIRANRRHRPMHLFFGTRHPDSDLLYGSDLVEWQRKGHLSSLTTAFSRHGLRTYVQDALRKDADHVVKLLKGGAQIMVCGGRDMAGAVRETLADILAATGQSPAQLKAEGRYVEDVY